MIIYVDTSFLVSIYIKDSHSPATDDLLRSRPQILLTPFHRAEWAHAVAQHIYRGVLTPLEADELYDELAQDERAGLWTEVPMPEDAFVVCADLARRHGGKLGMRALDSLHVACALELKADRFWTFDGRQGKLARAEGLRSYA